MIVFRTFSAADNNVMIFMQAGKLSINMIMTDTAAVTPGSVFN
jgi:hypothetical protein